MSCPGCGAIPARTAAYISDDKFPVPVKMLRPLEIGRDDDLWECPPCGALFLWHVDTSFTGSGESDQMVLTRFLEDQAAVLRAFVHRGDRPAEEVASLTERCLALPGAAPNLVSSLALKRDRELSRALVPRMLDALARGDPPYVPRSFLVDFASDHDADFVQSELEQRPAAAAFESLRAHCRTVLLKSRALGLALLQEGRWAEAARVLEGVLRREGDSRAADLHNLAVARTRAGDARGGLEAARKAVALRQNLQGAYHPDTLESALVAAHALLETGDGSGAADEVRRAATAIRSQAGEAHPFFADALLIEARRVAKLGDGGAAEALARRALFIVKSAEVDGHALRHRESDAAAIGKLWRTAPGARGLDDIALWRMSLNHTLRRYRPETLDFAPSGDRPKEWYFFVPGGWPIGQATYGARVVFADLSRALNEREPADAAFLDATQAHAAPTDPRGMAEVDLAGPFRGKTWEPTAAFSLVRGGSSVPLSPDSFAKALAALGAPHTPLLPLVVEPAVLVQARANRGETLTEVFGL